MYSMKRSVCGGSTEVTGEPDDLAFVGAALDDAVHLHGQAGSGCCGDALEHAIHGQVGVVQCPERCVVERVEADGDALEPRVGEELRLRAAGATPLVVRVRSAPSGASMRDETLELATHERLPTRDADLLDAQFDEPAGDARDLLEREELAPFEERVVASEDVSSACSRRTGSCSGR